MGVNMEFNMEVNMEAPWGRLWVGGTVQDSFFLLFLLNRPVLVPSWSRLVPVLVPVLVPALDSLA